MGIYAWGCHGSRGRMAASWGGSRGENNVAASFEVIFDKFVHGPKDAKIACIYIYIYICIFFACVPW